MKKSLIALAVLAASGAAMAQSSVTLYGVVDTGLTYSKGDESVYGLTHVGGNVNSRLGFRGVEDLGNGLKATFNLESGLSADNGGNYMNESGLTFNRTSTIGLAGGFGEVRLGRMLTSSYLAVSRYDAFGDTGIGASRAWGNWVSETEPFAALGAYPTRASNAISYTSPNFSGFKFGGEYAFGEQQKASDSRYIGVSATYDNGPLSLGLGFDRIDGNTNNGTDFTIDQTSWQLGGGYNFGVARLLGFYKESKFKDDGVGAAGESAKFKTFGLGVTAPVGAAGEVRASYNHYRASDDGDTLKANQLSLGYVHNLSKRTALYGTYAYIKNKNKDGDNLGLQLNGAMPGAGLSDSGAQHGLQLGVRHAF